MTTALGGEVPLDDWLNFHRDRLLSVLFQLYQQGQPSPGFQLSMTAGVTGLEEADPEVLAENLVEDGQLVKKGDVYKLAREGMEWVRASPAA